ncbi:MAG: hypothetical protein GY898_10965 [Proteobacteria bacterium]|nr:hypothetical protein [Pseudomonadota bacterium]
MRRLFALLPLLVACSTPTTPPVASPPVDVPDPGPTLTPELADPTVTVEGVSPGDDFSGLADLPCATGADSCAALGPYLGESCCAYGDSVVAISTANASEAVDLETDGEHVWACGGFGVRISDISDPNAPVSVGSVGGRCQRIGVGPLRDDGARIFWLSHHGDGWIPTPNLITYHLSADDAVTVIDTIEDPEVNFEGLLEHDGFLFVAAHAAGLRVYTYDADGVPTFVHSIVEGFDNASKMAVHGDRLYVTDDDELIVVDITDPTAAAIVGSPLTSGAPRDVAVEGDRIFVAVGARGVDVFDVGPDGALVEVTNLPSDGSSQAVSTSDGVLAVADWSHASMYDVATLVRVGTERTRTFPFFEQDLGIVMTGDVAIVAEWEGMHLLRYAPGYVAPDLFVTDELLGFDAAEASTRTLDLRNRGPLDLVVSSMGVSDDAFTLSDTGLVVPAYDERSVDVTYAPPPPSGSAQTLRIISNDVDATDNPLQIPLHAIDSAGLDVGDSIDYEAFEFLGGEALEGKVVVLAYFALF